MKVLYTADGTINSAQGARGGGGGSPCQALKRELDEAKGRLADRRDIDRAKGLLMQRRGLTEEQAYEQLRKAAMNRNLRIGDAARAVIAAADLL